MKKSVRGVLLLVVLSLTILLSACGGRPAAGERPLDTAAALKLVQTGTQGVAISTIQNLPPPLIYDQNPFVALIEVKNKGNHDLQREDCFVQITGFDPNIMGHELVGPRSCAENVGVLEGKNVYNTEGSFNQVEFRSSSVALPLDVYEYNPRLNILACYNYITKASPQVCVDPLFYQVTSQQKACTPTDISMGGGQGAPVGISYVGVDMVGDKAIFEINVVNQGGGRVLSPDTDIRSCEGNLEYTDLDKVYVRNVQLSGGSKINCNPTDNYVRLTNNQGKIICTFDISGASAAFESPLVIELEYNYVDSITQPVKIIQTPGG